jgi:hypothetical protein
MIVNSGQRWLADHPGQPEYTPTIAEKRHAVPKERTTAATTTGSAALFLFNRDIGWSDTTMEYYMQDDLNESYDNYWDEHEQLQSKIVAVRSSFFS